MTPLRVFLSRVLDLVLRRQRDDRLREEVQTHLDLLASEYIAAGMPAEEARLAARRAFGGVDRMQMMYREQRGLPIVDSVTQDVRFAVRLLRKDLRFTLAAVVALALGIGANTAIFSLIESLMLRPLPVKNPSELVIVAHGDPSRTAFSNPVWEAIRSRRALVRSAFAWSFARFNLTTGGEALLVDGLWASGRAFETLGVSAIRGRLFREEDDVRGGGVDGPVTVISYQFWRRYFGGAAATVGRTLTIGGVAHTIVGITPPEFFGPDVGRSFDIIVPIGSEPLLMGLASGLDEPAQRWLTIMARLEPGQSLDEATAALHGVQPQIREETMLAAYSHAAEREAYLKAPLMLVPASTGISPLRTRYERPLLAIFVVVALVLLIACTNVAMLLLSRAAARRHEWSVRLAMGASRSRLVRQLLVESLLLSGAGALIGIVLARWASQGLVQQLSTQANRVFLDLAIDGRILLFTIIVTVLTALLFGIVPALRAADASPIDAIKDQGRGTVGSRRIGIPSSLVVTQVALAVVLVVAAGLFVRTFVALANRDLGFDRDGILLVDVNARQATMDVDERLGTYGRLQEHVLAVPGVAAAAVSFEVPLTGGVWDNRVVVSNGVSVPEAQRRSNFNAVSPGWFATYGVPILDGRDVSSGDRMSSAPVIVVNEAFARRFFNGANPLGETVAIHYGAYGTPPREIVGLVADTVYSSPRQQPPPTMYVPLAQFKTPFDYVPMDASVSVRVSTGSPALLARSVGAAIGNVNRDLALTFRPLADQINASMTRERVVAMLAGVFGALALLLAALGLFGVTSYAVVQRRQEIGVRLALGASPATVLRMVIARVATLVGLGVIIGTGLSLWASRFVATLLFGLQPSDPATLIGAAVVLASVGLLAGWLPARRASRIDPVTALRES